ncbi:MAG: ABC transporter ATP-binding protein [Bacteriovoracales bacterium]|nr:ABC transporter ATP-binding protein [Bacteriovoracales bacterium]
MIVVKSLKKSYGDREVLRGIDFSLSRGEQCIIRGASGSGKSTFLYLLGGLESLDEGSIAVDGFELGHSEDDSLAKYRNTHIGFVFQFHFLLSSMKVIDNIYLPARIGGEVSREVKERVEEISHRIGIDHCLKKYPYQLSGGEQQRVNIVRACSLAPKLLLCDEPTGNLDLENTQNVVQLLKNLSSSLGLSLVVVTHDGEVARQFERVFTMNDGLIAES